MNGKQSIVVVVVSGATILKISFRELSFYFQIVLNMM